MLRPLLRPSPSDGPRTVRPGATGRDAFPPPSRPAPVWLAAAGRRVLVWWPAKMLGTTLGMAVFFTAYFAVLRHPLYPVTTLPLTAVDDAIGFQPAALPLYLSLWVYVSLAPALLIVRRELVSFGLAWIALSVAGLACFLVWPTTVPSLDAAWSPPPVLALLHSVDAAGNACPSLHVAFAVFTAAWLSRLLRQLGAGRPARSLNWLWCAGILYSTMATRQHVAVDVLAGAGLGALAAFGHLRWLRNAERRS